MLKKSIPAFLAGLVGLLVGATALSVASAAPPDPADYSFGRVETCTIDANSGCTVTHGLGVKPNAIVANNSGAAIVYIDPSQINATTYRIGFKRSDNTNYVAGIVARYTVHYDLPASVIPPTTTPPAPPTTTPPAPPTTTNPPPPETTTPPPAPVTKFGSNVDGTTGTETFAQALARQDAEYDPDVMRLFYSGLPSTNCAEQRIALANARPGSTISFKGDPATVVAGGSDATINAFLSCLTVPTYISWYHEPEDNFTTAAQKAQYIAGFQRVAGLVHAKPGLSMMQIYSDFTWDSTANRNPDDWYAGSAAVDIIGVDWYGFADRNADHTDNQTPAQHDTARPSYAWVQTKSKPYAIPELGYDDDTVRPAFIGQMATWARDKNVVHVEYFDSFLSGGLGDHRLDQTDSQDAWDALTVD